VSEFLKLSQAHLGIGKPNKDVVALLRDALAMAKRGEISGIAIAAVEANNATRTSYATGCADKGLMMLAVHSLHTRITQAWFNSDTKYEDIK
jgi:hypothetical protein